MPRWCAAPTASASGIARASTRSSGKPAFGNQVRERLAVDELERQKRDAVALPRPSEW